MPDITMCSNRLCPLRSGCYRYRAVPGRFQSFGSFEPLTAKKCDYHLPIWEQSKGVLTTHEVDARHDLSDKAKLEQAICDDEYDDDEYDDDEYDQEECDD